MRSWRMGFLGWVVHPNQFARKLREERGQPIDEDGGMKSRQAVWKRFQRIAASTRDNCLERLGYESARLQPLLESFLQRVLNQGCIAPCAADTAQLPIVDRSA